MNGLINFIKGIFGFIGGLFGGKKPSNAAKKGKGYFLELDETAAPVAETPAAVPAESTPAPAAPAVQPKTSTRKEKLAALAAESTPAPAAAPVAPVAPVAPKPAPAPVLPAETAFATKYLVPANSAPRRRPGANMSSYVDMARKMGGAMN